MISPSTEMASSSPAPSKESERASVSDIDASCRWPVLALLLGALSWLVAASALQLLGSAKLLVPGLLAQFDFLTYGRIEGAAPCALVFGFSIPALMGLSAWVLCRLGGQTLAGSPGLWIFGLVWNVSLLAAVAGILGGDGAGLAWFELPIYGAAPMAAAYIVGAGVLLLNLEMRANRELQVSQWFMLSALVWFGWAFTAAIILNRAFSSGLIHLVVGYWFKQQLLFMTLIPGGLALVFYVVPKLISGPVRTRSTALFAFWTLVFIGPWGGMPQSAPLPAWMVAVGVVASTLFLAPALAVLLTLRETVAGNCAPLRNSADGSLVLGSAGALALFALVNWVRHWPSIAGVVELSVFSKGVSLLLVLGVCGLAILAGIHHAVPRLTGASWTRPGWASKHGVISCLGVLAIVGGLLAAGVFQGLQSNRIGSTASEVLASGRPMLGLSALGCALFFMAQAAFLGAVLRQSLLACKACCLPCVCDWMQAGHAGKTEAGR